MNVLSFPEQPSICPVLSLKDYLVRTSPLRAVDANNMFIQLREPHKSVSSDIGSLGNEYYGRCRCGHQYVLSAQHSQCLGCMVRDRFQEDVCGLNL